MRPRFKSKKPKQVVYRFYYNPVTLIGIEKSVDDINSQYPYIELTSVQYENIDFCTNYRVNQNTVEKILLDNGILKYVRSARGTVRTLKNNMLFVQKDTAKNADTWTLK